MNKSNTPTPVQLPTPTAPHPSEAQAAAYQDPNAPKAKKKLHKSWVIAGIVIVLVVAGAAVAYMRFVTDKNSSSVVEDYSGGIANPNASSSVVTPETEVAKKFLKAVQAGDSATVQELSGEPLLQLVAEQTGDSTASVLSLYQGKFDGVDFNSLVASVSDSGPASGVSGKWVTFSDSSVSTSSTNTYRVSLMVIAENDTLRIATISSDLTF